MVFVSGAVGGFFGPPWPNRRTSSLYSPDASFIADIARSEGEELSSIDTHLACITVFALGGRSRSDNAADTTTMSLERQ